MTHKNIVHIKMSQIDWKQSPTDYVTTPRQDSGISVTPTLYLSPAVKDTLKKIDAIGFDISTKQKAQLLLRFLADKSIFKAIQDMTPDEYVMVMSQYVQGTPPSQSNIESQPAPSLVSDPQTMGEAVDPNLGKTSMYRIVAQSSEMLELLRLLMDVGFEIDNPRWAEMVLQELSRSNSPSAPLAAQLAQVATNQGSWEELMRQVGEGSQLSPGELNQPGTILEKTYFPNELYSPGEAPVEDDTLDEMQEMPTPTPPQPAPPPIEAPAPAPAPAPAMPAMPTKTKGQGAAATSKQLQETVAKFEELKMATPTGVKSLNWGDNSGVKIRTKDGRGQDVAKGGMLLKNYATTEDGIVVGVAPGNRLYVRVPPELTTAEWDPNEQDIRISLHDKKWKPEGY